MWSQQTFILNSQAKQETATDMWNISSVLPDVKVRGQHGTKEPRLWLGPDTGAG